jgi:hypothetical protein
MFNFKCEICNEKYNYTSQTAIKDKHLMFMEIIAYVLVISLTLFLGYLCVGNLLYSWSKTRDLFVTVSSKWGSVMLNGFIMIHIIVGLIYVIIAMTNNTGICCFIYFNGGITVHDNSCLVVIVGIMMLITIIALFVIYIDVIYNIVQKYKIQTSEIDFLPFTDI